MMKLLEGVDVTQITGETQREIEGIAYHSRKVEKGFLFAAIRGMEFNGHQFIGDAIGRGAAAVLLEEDPGLSDGTWIRVPDSRRALARVSANFYGHPSDQIRLIGVTGTNGKTTTTYLMESIFERAGYSVGVLGTINYRYGKKVIQAVNTTPESLDLQRILGEMVRNGVSHVIMEVSSHGLDLDRVFGCQFDGAVFTNLTSDHLDYHKTVERYFESKRKLFSDHLTQSPKAGRFAVTNGDDPKGEAIVEGIPLPVIRYGLNPSCEVRADQERLTLEGLSCRIQTPRGPLMVQSRMIGSYNLYNILAAVSVGIATNLPLRTIQAGVEAVEGVPGRFERVENQRGIHIIVDYAHTRDALERVLAALKETLSNPSPDPASSRSPSDGAKIITVFGCGGDRDRTKRPLMGEVAGRYSDLCLLTSDNPRTEDPGVIIREAEEGLKKLALRRWDLKEVGSWRSEKGYLTLSDRREAIRMAIRLARRGDALLIAGKGHEDYQIIGKEKFPFDDRAEARKALEEV